jgi:diamine N-acetyltransferase
VVEVVLRLITSRNWEDAANLSVRDDQKDFVAPNVWSVADSKFHDALEPMAIYDGETMVGFLMYGLDPEDNRHWLYRFMIDRRFQGRGYGRAAMERLIALMKRIPGCTGISVGYEPENLAAERLYFSLGFVPTGMAPWGEKTARLTFLPGEE